MTPASMLTSQQSIRSKRTNNPENERIKRAYFAYLKEARRYGDGSLDSVVKALHRFEDYSGFRSFKLFHIQQAVAFKRNLAEQTSRATGEKLSKATVYATLMALRNFFHWLAGQPGYRSRLSYGDADYFNLSEKESRIAKSHAPERVPSLEQINHVLGVMPTNTDIELRNRALIAFAVLTGCRDNAIASLKLKHVDLSERRVHQDPREVRTKFAKTIITTFFPVDDLARQIVEAWVEHLRLALQFGPDDPLFPATRVALGASGLFETSGFDRKHWSNASPIRAVFRNAFTAAGLPYFNPHSVRKTLVQLGQRVCRSPEEYKAWSQNLGHEGVMTTFTSYGSISPTRQAEIIRDLACAGSSEDGDRTILEQIRRLANRT
jgi:integrase